MASATGLSSGTEPVVASEVMRKLMRMAERVARSGATVLITGETGSGKELIARAIHHYSARASKSWVDLNCAALPENLVESELFGYEKGAFSGADASKPGLFELADKGTLFLDEIGELEPKVQVKLLRVLDGAPYFRLGGSRKISVDVRIVAATNQELDSAVRSRRFRADLFHRLSQFQLKVPPLRERPEDVVAIAQSFLQQHKAEGQFAPDALDLLRRYDWPGNVRELRNVVLQAATLTEGTLIGAEDLGLAVPEARAKEPAEITTGDLDEIERRAIERALERTLGNQSRAAEHLGISRRTLSRKLKQYKLESEMRGVVLGQMSAMEAQRFRVDVEGPVFIRTARGEELQATLVNASARGLMICGVDNPFQFAGMLDVQFSLPGCPVGITAKGRLVWADQQHRAGIHLTEIPADAELALTNWLIYTRKEEGWDTTVSPLIKKLRFLNTRGWPCLCFGPTCETGGISFLP